MQQKKTFSSKSVAEKTGQLCVEIRTQSNTMFKNKLKINYRCKCKTGKYKALREKQRYTNPKKVTERSSMTNCLE